MIRKQPKEKAYNSNFAFFFLLLYTIALLIRPQEWSTSFSQNPQDQIPIARYLLIISFFSYLFLQKPKVWGYHGWFLSILSFVVLLSGIRNGWISGGFTQAQNFIIYGLIPYILYAGLVNTPTKHNIILIIIAIACSTMLHHGISQTMSLDATAWSGVKAFNGIRITYLGFFNDPNDLGMFFVMSIPLIYYLRSITKSRVIKFYLDLLIVGLIYGIYLTNSRGAFVGLISLVLTIYYFNYGKIKTLFFTLLSLPVVYFAMSLFREIDSEEASAYGRIDAWYQGIQMLIHHPIFGTGKGSFMDYNSIGAHNSFVLVMAELGTLGYTLWFTTIMLTIYMLIKVFNLSKVKYADSPVLLNEILLAKCLFFSFIGYMSTGFFLSRSYVVYLYLFIGLAVALYFRVAKQVPEIASDIDAKLIWFLFSYSLISIVIMYFIVVVLL